MSRGIIYKNGIPYSDCVNEDIQTATLSQRAIYDKNGDKIYNGYMRYVSSNGIDGKWVYKNSKYRGKDLTDRFESGDIYKEISDGKFRDMYIGDYFITNGIKFSITGFTETKNGATYYRSMLLVASHNTIIQMNTTNIATRFDETDIYTVITSGWLYDQITEIFDNHLCQMDVGYGNTSDTSTIVGSGLKDYGIADYYKSSTCIIDLLTESEVFGSRIWSSSGEYENKSDRYTFNYYNYGGQLPIFSLSPSEIPFSDPKYKTESDQKYHRWILKSRASATKYCAVADTGLPVYINASDPGYLRYKILIK